MQVLSGCLRISQVLIGSHSAFSIIVVMNSVFCCVLFRVVSLFSRAVTRSSRNISCRSGVSVFISSLKAAAISCFNAVRFFGGV